jgi:fatty acid desaturase
VISLLIGFSIQSAHMLFDSRRRGYLSAGEHWRALGETALGVALWSTLGWAIGPFNFLLCFALPLVVANCIVMGLILTNHSLSPLTAINDPLANSLSVTAPRLVEWLTLGFGYHVEHHLFPAMSARHGRQVRDVLIARWPNRYQSLPILRALLALHRSPRVYKDDVTLIDPRTRSEWPALAARTGMPEPRVILAEAPLGVVPPPQVVPAPQYGGGE